VDFVDFGNAAEVNAALAKPAAMVWIETPSNPLLRITDIADIARRRPRHGRAGRRRQHLPVAGWQRPLELGADVVVHSTTKYIKATATWSVGQ
jgi:cystathionine beta-lyase/cystathionine gamma-synthase